MDSAKTFKSAAQEVKRIVRAKEIQQYLINKVGEVVLLKDDKSARSLWKLAKIVELIPSQDNEMRAAKVRVVNSDEGRSVMLRRRYNT